MLSYSNSHTSATKNATDARHPGRQAIALLDNRKQTGTVQRRQKYLEDNRPGYVVQRNQTGLPDHLKSGIENISGFSMDDVKVHYHSSRPAQLNAHAYAQGTNIHIAPGQEKHLPHGACTVGGALPGRTH